MAKILEVMKAIILKIWGVICFCCSKVWTSSTKNDDDFKEWFNEQTKKVEEMLRRTDVLMLNKKQCQHLVTKLHNVVEAIQEMPTIGKDPEYKVVLMNLRDIVLKVSSMVEQCGIKDLCAAIDYQLENKDTFQEVLLKLERLFNTLQGMYQDIALNPKDHSIDFGIASHDVEQYAEVITQWYYDQTVKVEEIVARTQRPMLNEKQCQHLAKKLHEVVDSLKWMREMMWRGGEVKRCKYILMDLHRLILKVSSIIEQCGSEDLSAAAVYQLENEESFRELLLELECFFNASYVLYQVFFPNPKDLSIDFDILLCIDVDHDRKAFKEKLEMHSKNIESFSNESSELAQYLLQRLKNLDQVKGGELDTLQFTDCGMFDKGIQLGKPGASGSVFESNWLGLTCATKELNASQEDSNNSIKEDCDEETKIQFLNEACILAGLNHPNLVKFIGMGQRGGWPFLMMEKMDNNIANLIPQDISKDLRPLPYTVLIDIIHQIASGIYYLHDMHVAHRDLKPDNVLWTGLEVQSTSSPFGCVKLTDFGISKIEVGSETIELSKHRAGTSKYMAPEVYMNDLNHKLNYFQADVYSFGIMCTEILCGKVEFDQPYKYAKDIHKLIKDGRRPILQGYSKELTTLIGDCCTFIPSERPKFSEIWKRLTKLKTNFLAGIEGDFNLHDNSLSKIKEAKQGKKDSQLYGIEDKIKEVQHHLQKVNSLGIFGMGGIGKSTLVDAYFRIEEGNPKFNKRCFHRVGKLRSNEECLQVLQAILKKLDVEEDLRDLDHGKFEMHKVLARYKVLLILDDVWESCYLNNIILQGTFSSYKNSTLIVCSRNWDEIKDHVQERYDLQPLKDVDLATKLFITHCFDRSDLPNQFEHLGPQIVQACKGLPLSLKVLGAFLHGKERLRSWERVLQRLKRGRSPQPGHLEDDLKLFEVLEVSFEDLEGEEKDMFLDICCFFLQDVYGRILYFHEIFNILTHGESTLIKAFETLIHRSLVERDQYGCLQMHDQLRDMGRKIVELRWDAQMSEKKYAGTRIQHLDSIISERKVEKKIQFETVEGILCEVSIKDANLYNYINEQKFSKLRILLIRTNFENIPFDFNNFTNLTILDLYNCKNVLKLPDAIGNFISLKSCNLVQCKNLTSLPINIENLSSLTSLDLNGCSRLSTLPDGFGNLSSLTSLNLSGCSQLSALPDGFGNLSSLTSLDLSGCFTLSTLPDGFKNLSSLISLNLKWCSLLSALPDGFGNLSSLTSLNLSGCSQLSALPDGFGNLSSLTSLDLSGYSQLSALPDGFGNLSSLTSLNLRRCSKLSTLPHGFGNLSSLTSLDLNGCSQLSALPDGFGNLSSLTSLDLSGCSTLSTLPDGFGNLSSLTSLNLSGCSQLSALPDGFGNLSSLTSLDLSGYSQLSALPDGFGNLSSLTSLNLRRCSTLSTLPDGFGNLSSLTSLDLNGCSQLSALPDGFGNLSSLTSLDLWGCSTLSTLPDGFGNLSSLTSLDLSGCSQLLALPDGFGNLSSLTSLDLWGCSTLSTLPYGFGNLSSLTSLNLEWCSKLSTLPDGFENLSSLTSLNLSGCSQLSALPDGFGNLSSLTSLDLNGCSQLSALPDGFGNLSSLTSLNLRRCSKLSTLPHGFGNLSSLTSLDLNECSQLSALPDGFGNLSFLTSLDLWGCSTLSTLPDGFENLSSLISLNLSGCSQLSALPDGFGNLSSLTSLGLNGCSQLSTLPDGFGNLCSLTSLNLRRCSTLSTLPNGFGNLSSLTSLDLSGCSQLSALPDGFGNLSSLTSLDLNRCSQLSALPDGFENLSSLTSLHLWGCSTPSTLPDGFGNLSSLRSL